MLRVVGCFTNEHDIKLVLAAAMVCVLGSVLTVRLFMRARNAIQRDGRFQIGLTTCMVIMPVMLPLQRLPNGFSRF